MNNIFEKIFAELLPYDGFAPQSDLTIKGIFTIKTHVQRWFLEVLMETISSFLIR